MAFFKFRLPGQHPADAQGNFSNPPTESVEVLRRRARHRLIGATVLVLVGVIGFPMVFDTQPRPVSADITIDIPDRAKAVASGAITPAPQPLQAAATLDPKEEVVAKSDSAGAVTSNAATPSPNSAASGSSTASAPSSGATVSAASAVVAAKSEPAKSEQPKAETSKAEPTKSDAAKAESVATKANDARFVVQVGAFAEEAKVRELRSKVEKIGLKTYTQEASTKEGKRIRVRVGPFASRDEADKAADKLKQINLQPQILSL